MQHADLTGACVRFADLNLADLSNATLTQTILGSSDLRAANLTNADLIQVRLDGSDLTDARLTGADLRRSTITPEQLHQALDITVAIVTQEQAQNLPDRTAALCRVIPFSDIRAYLWDSGLKDQKLTVPAAGGHADLQVPARLSHFDSDTYADVFLPAVAVHLGDILGSPDILDAADAASILNTAHQTYAGQSMGVQDIPGLLAGTILRHVDQIRDLRDGLSRNG
jgi:hypothetical protein